MQGINYAYSALTLARLHVLTGFDVTTASSGVEMYLYYSTDAAVWNTYTPEGAEDPVSQTAAIKIGQLLIYYISELLILARVADVRVDLLLSGCARRHDVIIPLRASTAGEIPARRDA